MTELTLVFKLKMEESIVPKCQEEIDWIKKDILVTDDPKKFYLQSNEIGDTLGQVSLTDYHPSYDVTTKEGFVKQEKALEMELNARKFAMYKAYAFANNPHKVGDIISDFQGRIRIERIEVVKDFNRYPYCKYKGIVINQDGSDSKRGKRRTILQINLMK